MAHKKEYPLIDMHGRRFGRWTVTKFTEWHTQPCGKRKDYWACVCDCGKTAEVRGWSLREGTSKSCGCLKIENVKKALGMGEEGLVNQLFRSYRQGAASRKICFDITIEDFKTLIYSNCAYCGVEPEPTPLGRNRLEIKKNGVDRVNNAEGYTKTNCVACCRHCNKAKGVRSAEEFKTWIFRAANFIRSQDERNS